MDIRSLNLLEEVEKLSGQIRELDVRIDKLKKKSKQAERTSSLDLTSQMFKFLNHQQATAKVTDMETIDALSEILNGLSIRTVKEDFTQKDKQGAKLKIQLLDIDKEVIGGFVVDTLNSNIAPNENLAEHVALYTKRVLTNYLLESFRGYMAEKKKENKNEAEIVD